MLSFFSFCWYWCCCRYYCLLLLLSDYSHRFSRFFFFIYLFSFSFFFARLAGSSFGLLQIDRGCPERGEKRRKLANKKRFSFKSSSILWILLKSKPILACCGETFNRLAKIQHLFWVTPPEKTANKAHQLMNQWNWIEFVNYLPETSVAATRRRHRWNLTDIFEMGNSSEHFETNSNRTTRLITGRSWFKRSFEGFQDGNSWALFKWDHSRARYTFH